MQGTIMALVVVMAFRSVEEGHMSNEGLIRGTVAVSAMGFIGRSVIE